MAKTVKIDLIPFVIFIVRLSLFSFASLRRYSNLFAASKHIAFTLLLHSLCHLSRRTSENEMCIRI